MTSADNNKTNCGEVVRKWPYISLDIQDVKKKVLIGSKRKVEKFLSFFSLFV